MGIIQMRGRKRVCNSNRVTILFSFVFGYLTMADILDMAFSIFSLSCITVGNMQLCLLSGFPLSMC